MTEDDKSKFKISKFLKLPATISWYWYFVIPKNHLNSIYYEPASSIVNLFLDCYERKW